MKISLEVSIHQGLRTHAHWKLPRLGEWIYKIMQEWFKSGAWSMWMSNTQNGGIITMNEFFPICIWPYSYSYCIWWHKIKQYLLYKNVNRETERTQWQFWFWRKWVDQKKTSKSNQGTLFTFLSNERFQYLHKLLNLSKLKPDFFNFAFGNYSFW